jgi:hypothetical protein
MFVLDLHKFHHTVHRKLVFAGRIYNVPYIVNIL